VRGTSAGHLVKLRTAQSVLQDDGEGYDDEGMDEDELLDEDDIVDGASDGSDDAARMGIQSMQVSNTATYKSLSMHTRSPLSTPIGFCHYQKQAACVRTGFCGTCT